MGRWWGRVVRVGVANVVGVVLLLGLLEGAVRVLRPDIGPAGSEASLFLDGAFVDAEGRTTGLRPGATGEANGAPIQVDADGFHVYAGNAGLADSVGLWLWLGDSVAFGLGVPADSSVAGRLALAQDTARVRNPAVPGWGTADYRRRLDAALAQGLRPDRVTVLWCLNDANPARPRMAGDVSPLAAVPGRASTWLNVHSRLYRLVKDAAFDRPQRYLDHDRQFYESASPDSTSALVMPALAPLVAIRDTLAARDIPLEVVVVPYEPQLRPGGDRTPQRVLLPALARLGIRALDLYPAFEAAADGAPARLYLWSDGIHLSERGHAVAARAIARWQQRSAGPG